MFMFTQRCATQSYILFTQTKKRSTEYEFRKDKKRHCSQHPGLEMDVVHTVEKVSSRSNNEGLLLMSCSKKSQ